MTTEQEDDDRVGYAGQGRGRWLDSGTMAEQGDDGRVGGRWKSGGRGAITELGMMIEQEVMTEHGNDDRARGPWQSRKTMT